MGADREPALGAYAAKRCPRVAHNDHAPTSPPKASIDPAKQRLIEEGVLFERAITDRIEQAFEGSGRTVLDAASKNWEATTDATWEAMRDGIEVIINGRLPDVDGRRGAPDVLVRIGAGYIPIDIKNHQTLVESKTKSVTVSTIADPARRFAYPLRSDGTSNRRGDCMQLTHYTRMLQRLGCHPGGRADSDPELLFGGIIGTSDFTAATGDRYGITWYQLAQAREMTYSASASAHRRTRTMLDRYDHEFAFRRKVAAAARRGDEIVKPLGTEECDDCAWNSYCVTVAGPDDASFAIKTGRLDMREWKFLYDRGITTVETLARLDPASIAADFAEYSTKSKPAERLANATRRAQMALDGNAFQPVDGWPTIPAADIEADFDIEWDANGRIYQWGLRVRAGQDDSTARYETDFVSFDEIDDEAETALADKFAARINTLAEAADAQGKSFTVFHWHHVELTMTRKFPNVQAALQNRTFDLCRWYQANFFARDGSSIKIVAALFGFHWGVEDAGGHNSQAQVATARGSGPEAQAACEWLLRYNEADVAAQAAIRDGLRHLTADS
ncbi:MAG: ribonuclease H-like domain-containing protein [Actinomycetia bacterium]|nr:ribonuclease H-like domain-containing protein [Actinomycetes bacterium]